MFNCIYEYYTLFYTQKHRHTHNHFACFISIRLHDICLLINLNIVNVSQIIINLKSEFYQLLAYVINDLYILCFQNYCASLI